jgi:hypothetical protein
MSLTGAYGPGFESFRIADYYNNVRGDFRSPSKLGFLGLGASEANR